MSHTKSKQVVWITGASSGIGLALTKRYLDNGWKVLASARSEGELSPLLSLYDDLTFIAFDVTNESQISLVREQLSEHTEHLDCAILNAGSCEYLDLSVEQPDWDMSKRVMMVNFFGMIHSIDTCLPLLKKASRPHLVGVGSQAVNAAFPKAEAYGASKAAVRYFLASLRMDLVPFGIDVSCLLPGFVDTPLTKKNDFSMPFIMSSEDAAQCMFKAIQRRPYEYAFPKPLSTMLWFGRHFPKVWQSLLAPKKEI
ncbi:SDR family NAD(P)-dependent oxidoreductase [Marinomonas sp. C2222]|uniref:SDR family NAD(P)-dependent oxidoreductase n=1 Tax=Marinomonas sargassi TaxID=2984494 RepID=A0ABT2YUD3_9GAMM|nr:SDR family NAD(P)-dependent oxidoreductase [Marinomonas sargassi]MCV2403506.1 SDR family NAD(P)-dependent oxidoreductase [Marinomonas sargassi]